MFTTGGDTGAAVITTPGQTKSFNDPTPVSSPNDYRLWIWRFDFTLLTTSHRSVWTMNA